MPVYLYLFGISSSKPSTSPLFMSFAATTASFIFQLLLVVSGHFICPFISPDKSILNVPDLKKKVTSQKFQSAKF